ncbi:TetR/AcrR family transcriptional regulator [Nonomuraea africana]|uniref:AcrR family transcriptional regulator n=1 Tax=Nonomuraea africana TaxID=46171 RepID=A0ABR9KAA8_9ACTN|nr:TetR family transcriptional regulator [Nonomuraea africana]MBE1558950.1 AcrR family transcriptional regulator [Nonomuraea africana]
MATKDSTAATRAALLKAAGAEFAAYGLAGARVDRIAERAGVNKERIYGHFGTKEMLFDAVVTDAINDLTEQIAMPSDPVEYVAKLTDYYREHPQLVRLLMWEALNFRGPEQLPGFEARAERCGKKTEALAQGLGREVSPEVARLLYTLTGLALWPSMMPQLGRIMLGDDFDNAEAGRDQVAAFVAAALDAGPADRRS